MHNHPVHDFKGHGVGTFVHRLYLEPSLAFPKCNFKKAIYVNLTTTCQRCVTKPTTGPTKSHYHKGSAP